MISGAAPSLTRRRDFDALFGHGRRIRLGVLTVVRARVEGETRVAVVASRSVGPAVTRNRVKRRLRAALRSVQLPENEHIAVLAGPGCVDASFDGLVSRLEEGLSRKVGAHA